jgi:hypothetical protein
MYRAITLLGSALFVIAISNCSEKKQASVTWNMTIQDAGRDVLMDLTGATILFQEMTNGGTDRSELKIFDPNINARLAKMVDACSPGQPGRPSLGTTISSTECEIRYGGHTIIVRDKGHTIKIDGEQFQINPAEKPGFLVTAKDGHVTVLKEAGQQVVTPNGQ